VKPAPNGDRIGRASFAVAGVLAIIGFMRLGSDMLTDVNATWAQGLDGSWLRYLVRSATDGTWAGDLNVQYFKILAVPCGVGCRRALRTA
jgi:hypothetical protein